MGSVWLVEHAKLGRCAAIKVLHPEYSSRPEIVTRFFNEARAATAINDPGIVQIFDFGQHSDGSAYIVMELLDGEPLDRRLARFGALGLPEALRIMHQVASALGAAHARGIIHRDLKPENVFIVRDPAVDGGERAKILDFGIAKLVGDHAGVKTQTHTMMGTPRYMSPEQCRGAGLVDQRADVYALGCMLFMLLVGRPPFDAEGVGEIIAMHLREAPPMPSSLCSGIPPEIDQLVLRCLEKDPARRFGHGGELANALGSLRGLSLLLEVSRPGTAYTLSPPTTLSSAMGATGGPSVARPVRFRHSAMYMGLGFVAGGGAIAFAVIAGRPKMTSPRPGSTSVSAAAVPAPPVTAPAEPSHAPTVRAFDPNAEISARTTDVLRQFITWTRKHQGAPCPEITELVDAPRDPWGHVFRLTCTEQPGDQIVGTISDGPDGTPGTADDIASWQLGREVVDSVRGARWIAASPPLSEQLRIERGRTAGFNREPGTSIARPAESKAAIGVKRTQTKPDYTIELDENGLPVNR